MKLVTVSTIGRIPTREAPIAAPKKPFSERGVSKTLSSPNSLNKFAVVPYTDNLISSPIINTLGSLLISSAIASFIASAKIFSVIISSDNLWFRYGVCPHAIKQIFWLRKLTVTSKIHGFFDFFNRIFFYLFTL